MVLVTLNDKAVSGTADNEACASPKSAVFQRHLATDFLPLVRADGNYLLLEDGRKIFDASGGASVGCIGWGNKRVAQAITEQVLDAPYCATIFYTTKVQEDLCRTLVDSTGGHMSRAYIVSSGQYAGCRGTELPS